MGAYCAATLSLRRNLPPCGSVTLSLDQKAQRHVCEWGTSCIMNISQSRASSRREGGIRRTLVRVSCSLDGEIHLPEFRQYPRSQTGEVFVRQFLRDRSCPNASKHIRRHPLLVEEGGGSGPNIQTEPLIQFNSQFIQVEAPVAFNTAFQKLYRFL